MLPSWAPRWSACPAPTDARPRRRPLPPQVTAPFVLSPLCPPCHLCCHPGTACCPVSSRPGGSSESTGNARRSGLCELEARRRPRHVLPSFCLSPLSGTSVCPSAAVSAPRGGHGSSLRRPSAPLQGLWASTPASPFATTVPAPSVCRVGVGPAAPGPRAAWAGLVRSAELSVCRWPCPCRRAQVLLRQVAGGTLGLAGGSAH